MKRSRTQQTSIVSFAVLLALAAAPPLIRIYPVQAQAPTENSAAPTAVSSGTTVKIDGSSSLSQINEALKQRFEQKFPGTKVEAAYGGTDAAIQAVLDGKVDLAAIGRPLTAEEKGKGLVLAPITRNKIAIIVGANNPFKKGLTLEQFAKIFRGEISDWSALGRSSGPIRVIDRPDTSDTRQAFQNYPVFQKAPFKTGANAVKLSEDNTDAVIKGLGTNGIGYAIADQVTNKPDVHIVAMHNTLPTDSRYPFSQPLAYVYKGPEPSPGVKAFLGYAIAPENQQVVEQARVAEAVTAPTAASPTTEPSVDATTAPESTPAAPPTSTYTVTDPVPWWGWWLSIPILGGLLWWLLKGHGATAGAAAPGAVAAGVLGDAAESRIILTPRNCKDAYAYWEVPEATKASFHRQGGQTLALRLYDVTDIDLDHQNAHSVQQFECDERSQDLHVPIQVDNRDYLAELGYVTRDNHWLPVARSEHVRVPACTPADSNLGTGGQATVPHSATQRIGDAVKAGGLHWQGRLGQQPLGKLWRAIALLTIPRRKPHYPRSPEF